MEAERKKNKVIIGNGFLMKGKDSYKEKKNHPKPMH